MINNIHDELVACCKVLHIASTMADRAMTMTGNTNQEYLLNLLAFEVNSRRDKAISTKLNDCGIPYRESFDNITTSEIVFPGSMSFEDCRNLKFYNDRRNLILIGHTGTGKTMLSISIAVEACRRNIKVQFYQTAVLIKKFKSADSEEALNKLTNSLTKAHILILDEFGSVSYDPAASRMLFDYLSEVITANKQIIVLNTDKPFSRWPVIFDDRDLARMYVKRLTERSEMILFPGRDRRIHDPIIMKAYREMISSDLQEEDNDEDE